MSKISSQTVHHQQATKFASILRNHATKCVQWTTAFYQCKRLSLFPFSVKVFCEVVTVQTLDTIRRTLGLFLFSCYPLNLLSKYDSVNLTNRPQFSMVYTLIDHKNDVIKCSKLRWNHKPQVSGFAAKFRTFYGVISMVYKRV